jgi:hypothetical protein
MKTYTPPFAIWDWTYQIGYRFCFYLVIYHQAVIIDLVNMHYDLVDKHYGKQWRFWIRVH